jgi:hypothetical protein
VPCALQGRAPFVVIGAMEKHAILPESCAGRVSLASRPDHTSDSDEPDLAAHVPPEGGDLRHRPEARRRAACCT